MKKNILTMTTEELYREQMSTAEGDILDRMDAAVTEEEKWKLELDLMQAQSERIEAHIQRKYMKQWTGFATDVDLSNLRMIERIPMRIGGRLTERKAIIFMETGEWFFDGDKPYKNGKPVRFTNNEAVQKKTEELCEWVEKVRSHSYSVEEMEAMMAEAGV